MTGPLIRNISDTARWTAVFRARESERPDALFRDPWALRLAGERGEEIARGMKFAAKNTWSFVIRTSLFDQLITREIEGGVDLVVNLAAGLDARPYRMRLPASLKWVEVDLPDLLAYKEQVLAGEKPACSLERVRLDLSQAAARRDLFEALGRDSAKTLVISEGLIVYLTAEEVGALARDLAAPRSFRRWVTDLASPGLVRMLQKKMGSHLSQAGAPLKFGPAEGPAFFAPHGWKPQEVRSMLHAAGRAGRLPLFLRLMALFPETNGPQGSRPWSGVCLLARD